METIFEHNKKKIATTVLTLLVILSLFFAVKVINEIKKGKYIGTGTTNQSTISVNGKGEVFAIPNIANLSFSVSETSNTVKKAQDGVTEKMNDLLNFLDEKDMDEKDIKTMSYNIHPKYEWQQLKCFTYPCPSGENILVGYEARHNISLKIRNIDEVGDILSGLGEAGATNISGVSFSIDEEEELREDARALAIENAQEKAEQLAGELGVKLVRIINFYEQNGGVVPARFEVTAMDEAFRKREGINPPNIPVGENNLVSKVNITYEIK